MLAFGLEMFETTDADGRPSRPGELRSHGQCITFGLVKVERIVGLNVLQLLKVRLFASVQPALWQVP